MAGSLTISDDNIVITTITFASVAAENEAGFRNAAKTLGYTGVHSSDALNLITEFLATHFASLIDGGWHTVEKSDVNTTALATFDAAVSKLTVGTASTA